mmetsp:Transcript_8283/g.12248  ORF Transcript_8283/g.12248 Transcript_8283/m.12248 type:complete len:80 (-) Transcript_8283:153-392(-)
MLVNLSPTIASSQETLCSLRFASQVNQCELGRAKRSFTNATSDASNKSRKSSTVTTGTRLISSAPTPGAHVAHCCSAQQ